MCFIGSIVNRSEWEIVIPLYEESREITYLTVYPIELNLDGSTLTLNPGLG